MKQEGTWHLALGERAALRWGGGLGNAEGEGGVGRKTEGKGLGIGDWALVSEWKSHELGIWHLWFGIREGVRPRGLVRDWLCRMPNACLT
jgi:hypothetical protein